ncbi:hypothetical protein PAXRUDRAFT_128194, partial [Paxillus rubicundulus Ve08.2h10]
YYELMDSSDVYRIAMVLHPHHKLQYFQQANWEQDWINTAEELVREEYEHTYKSVADDSDRAQVLDKSAQTNNGTKKKPINFFDNLAALTPPKCADLRSEIDQYLSNDVEHLTNLLLWCYEHRGQYPHL